MRQSTKLALLVAILLLAGAASAQASPSISLLGGSALPVTAEGHRTVTARLEASGGQVICTSYGLTAEWTHLGSYSNTLVLQGCEFFGHEKCDTAGASEGELRTTSEARLVFISLSPLAVAGLIVLPETTITCGVAKVKVGGMYLVPVEATLGVDVTSFKERLTGSGGKPTTTEYFNEEGKKEVTSLLANFGSGFQKADFNVEGEVEDKTSQMIIING